MAFLENEALLERLAVNYDQDYFPESIGAFDDESYDDESYDDESGEFRPLSLLTGGISNAIGAAKNLLKGGGPPRSLNLQGVKPNLVGTGAIQPTSHLAGTVTNQQGQPFQVGLPPNIATKSDIETLKQAVDALNATTKKTTEAVNKNAQEAAKIATEINRVDAKHTKASEAQNAAIARLNSQASVTGKRLNAVGARIDKMDKDFKNFQQQSQMSMLMPMLMSKTPEVESITINPGGTATAAMQNTSYTSPQVTFKKQDDALLFMLPMMMSGGFGGSGSSGDQNAMLPMLMMLALSK